MYSYLIRYRVTVFQIDAEINFNQLITSNRVVIFIRLFSSVYCIQNVLLWKIFFPYIKFEFTVLFLQS